MYRERSYLSPVEKELLFVKWRKARGVEAVFLDLDGTICNTPCIFRKQASLALDLLSPNNPTLSREELETTFQTINERLFETHSVNPQKWNFFVDELTELYHLSDDIQQEMRGVLSQIYEIPVEMLEKAEETLQFLQQTQTPMGIVTHGNVGWTWRKYHWLQLSRFVGWDGIYIISEDSHKTDKRWREATSYFRVNPEECIVVGDSPRSDINPARRIGVRYCFLVDDPFQWIVQKEPVDDSVKKIKNIGHLMELGREELVVKTGLA